MGWCKVELLHGRKGFSTVHGPLTRANSVTRRTGPWTIAEKNEKLQQEYIMFGIFAMCLFGSIFTFFKFFTLRGCFEGIRDCFKGKDGGYKGGLSNSTF